MQTVRAAEQPFAPALDEIAVAIKHHHRVGAAIEQIDSVFAVDRDRSDVGQVPAVGKLGPVLDHTIAMLARAKNDRHAFPPNIRSGDCFRPHAGGRGGFVAWQPAEGRVAGCYSTARGLEVAGAVSIGLSAEAPSGISTPNDPASFLPRSQTTICTPISSTDRKSTRLNSQSRQ